MQPKKYSFTKDELIEEVRNDTEIGKKIAEVEMFWLRSFKDNNFIQKLTSNVKK